jgi:hypothetical protein
VTDDDLRARLRRTDPAATLPPASPDDVDRLLGDTMTTTALRPAPHRWAILAAAAFVLIVAAAGWLLTRPSPDRDVATAPIPSDRPATTTAPVPSDRPVTTTAPVPSDGPATTIALDGVAAKCREPRPDQLAKTAEFAFAGTVTDISANMVTIVVSHTYKGAAFAEVKVAQEGDSSEQMLGSGKFETGRRYLVASAQGQVLICGYSGEADSPGLQELYDRAF